MVIDFLTYAEAKQAQRAALDYLEAERLAEQARHERLEMILGDLLADLLAA